MFWKRIHYSIAQPVQAHWGSADRGDMVIRTTWTLPVISFAIGSDARSRSASGRVLIVVTRPASRTTTLPSSSATAVVHVFCAEEVADVAATSLEAIMHALVIGFSELRLDNFSIQRLFSREFW